MRRVIAMLVASGACGDAIDVPPRIESVSGSRVKLEVYGYDTGVRHADPRAFYDVQLHTRCEPRSWSDGTLRCVPIADEAVYTDAECTELVGVAPIPPPRPPGYFLAFDWIDAAVVPARLFRAGETTDPINSYYVRREDACVGPYAPPSDATYYQIGDELAATAMAVLEQTELGTGRLALRMLHTSDGMQVVAGALDRAHDLPCAPAPRRDGVACEPTDAVTATRFLDTACTRPVIVADDVPRVARAHSRDGCASFVAIGDEVSAPLYRVEDGICVRTSIPPGQRAFVLGSPLELAPIEASGDASTGDRLAPVMLSDPSDPALRFAADWFVDHAIEAGCRADKLGDELRCLPIATLSAMTLYTAGCVAPVPVVEVPDRTCGPVAYARATHSDGIGVSMHAIGTPTSGTLYWLAGGMCVRHTVEPGRVVRALGPALPAQTFVGAVKYGER